ncbi:MAG: hypothetical protein WC812_02650 [Candidatus Pacearchaeota archaeon]|jgi:hypothetical protein
MTENKYSCSDCNKEFQNGESVAVTSNKKYYHCSARDLKIMPVSCLFNYISSEIHPTIIIDKKIYFEGNFYSFKKIRRIFKNDRLTIELNNETTGDIIKGDLSKLKKGLIARIFR